MTTVTTTKELPATALAVSGNLARDPELSYSAAGRPWCRCRVAVSQNHKGDDGTWHDGPPEYISLVCFGKLAENVAASLRKGDRIVAKGRFEEEHWTGKDGTKQTGWKLVAEDVGVSLAFSAVTAERPAHKDARPEAGGGYVPPYAEEEEPF